MKINKGSIRGAAHLYEKQHQAIESKKQAARKDIKDKALEATESAEVIISDEAKELAKTGHLDAGRQEKLAKLKAQIKAGTYRPKTEDIANSIVKHLFGAR